MSDLIERINEFCKLYSGAAQETVTRIRELESATAAMADELRRVDQLDCITRIRELEAENERLRLAVTNKNEACQELADRIRELEAENERRKQNGIALCTALIRQQERIEVAQAFRALAKPSAEEN
jgi:L-fucose isomerase-like protein